MGTAKNKGYIKPAQIAVKWNESADSNNKKLTGDYISRTFRRILEKLGGEQDGTKLKDIYRSNSSQKNKNKNENKRIFFDSSKIVKIHKRMDEINVLEPGALAEFCKLDEEGMKLNPEYDKYKMDTCEIVKKIFELWNISKRGYFTNSEKNAFIEMLICLIPKEGKYKNKKKQREAEEIFYKNICEVQDIVNKHFMETRNSDFYMLRILRSASNYSGQYQLVRQWADKWICVMDTACKVSKNVNKIAMSVEDWYIKKFSPQDLAVGIPIWYYVDILKKDGSESGNQDSPLSKEPKDIGKNECITCVNEVINHSMKEEFEEDYYCFLNMAFMELEEIGELVNENPDRYLKKDKNRRDIENYNKADRITEKCLNIINPQKANIDPNYVKYFGVKL